MNQSTFRRYFLDQKLIKEPFYGRVLDAGGHRLYKRGEFRPPLASVEQWIYLNINPKTDPDYLSSIEEIPIENASFDIILCTEVIEHLENPEKALSELYRVLKSDGKLVCSIPFNFHIHSPPNDFQRWTRYRIDDILKKIGFRNIAICEMGGYFSVVYDMTRTFIQGGKHIVHKIALRLLSLFFKALIRLDKRYPSQYITTGYYICAWK